jgi:hypothetical protein
MSPCRRINRQAEAGPLRRGNRLGVAKEDLVLRQGIEFVTTGPIRADAQSAPPRLIFFSSRDRGPRDEKYARTGSPAGAAGRAVRSEDLGRLDRELALLVVPAGPGAEVVRGGGEGSAELQQRGETRFASGPLEQRDLGPMEVGPFSQFLLGDADRDPAPPQVLGEALLRGQSIAPRCRYLTRATRASRSIYSSSLRADNRSTDKTPNRPEYTGASATLVC